MFVYWVCHNWWQSSLNLCLKIAGFEPVTMEKWHFKKQSKIPKRRFSFQYRIQQLKIQSFFTVKKNYLTYIFNIRGFQKYPHNRSISFCSKVFPFRRILRFFPYYPNEGFESVRIGKCQNWKVSELKSVRIRKCHNWNLCQNQKVSELEFVSKSESVRIGICVRIFRFFEYACDTNHGIGDLYWHMAYT